MSRGMTKDVTMKEVLSLFASYNAHVNGEVFHLVSELTEELRNSQNGSYHGSLFGTLNHMYNSDVGWLRRLREHVKEYQSLAVPELQGDHPHRWDAALTPDFTTLAMRRPQLDELIIRFIAEVPEKDLAHSFTYTNYYGDVRTVTFGQALLHMFNHQTHHRGAVSEQLDRMKISNDYSGLVEMINAVDR